MIQLLDLQDIEEDTEGNGKENKEEDKSTPKHKNLKSDNKEVLKSLNSKDKQKLDSAAKDITKVEQENTKEYRPESQSEKEATEETLSWFAGACHVWQSSDDEQQKEIEYTPSNSKERKGLWPRLSSVNFFGLNIFKNLDRNFFKKFFYNLKLLYVKEFVPINSRAFDLLADYKTTISEDRIVLLDDHFGHPSSLKLRGTLDRDKIQ